MGNVSGRERRQRSRLQTVPRLSPEHHQPINVDANLSDEKPEHHQAIDMEANLSLCVDDEKQDVFECHICMELPTDPIATSCGHVFCWPCLYQWLREGQKPCPVCKFVLNRTCRILALHGAGDTNTIADIPPRPLNPALFVPSRKQVRTIMNGRAHDYTADCEEVTKATIAFRRLARLKKKNSQLIQRRNAMLEAIDMIREHADELDLLEAYGFGLHE